MPGGHMPALDAETFGQLYSRTHLILYRYIFGMLGGPANEVEDLTSEAYLRAWKARQGFSGSQEAALGWLIHIARNLVIDHVRRSKVRGVPQTIDDVQLSSPDPTPEAQAIASEQFRVLWRLLQGLPPDQKEILVLRYMLDWPVKRIASHLGLSENTTSTRLRRVIQRIRSQWPDQAHEDEDGEARRTTSG
jgi:RNA polymerase sigma-70 factor (ECF subfamily)